MNLELGYGGQMRIVFRLPINEKTLPTPKTYYDQVA